MNKISCKLNGCQRQTLSEDVFTHSLCYGQNVTWSTYSLISEFSPCLVAKAKEPSLLYLPIAGGEGEE